MPKCSLFAHLGPTQIRQVLEASYFPVSSYSQGKILAFRGDPCEELAIIYSGTLRADMTDPEGRSFTVEMLPACQPIASAILFSDDNVLPVNLIAHTDAKLVRLTKRQIYDLCRKDEKFFHALLADMGNKANFLSQRLWNTQFLDIEHKLANYLLEQCRRNDSDSFTIPVNKQQLADIFGIARPSLNRVCAQLQEKGIIEFHSREFRILDRGRLEAIMGERRR